MDTAATDGRRKRSETSRQRIVEAMIALVGEGQMSPGAEQVATRAGVGLRTVFRHFADMDSLYASMALRLEREYEDWLDPFEGPDWRAKLAEMIERRLGTYEKLMPYKRAADGHRHSLPTIQRNYGQRLAMMRERLVAIMPPAISGDPILLETLDLLLSFETWQRLRLDQHLPPAQARAVIESAVTRLTETVSP